tara:strand:+ start:4019 stop:9685 length:5667 start_codon:yes stop_codon:yes gene_type:complete
MSSRRYTTEFVIKGDSTSAVQASRDLQRANSDLAREIENTERQSEEMAASFESVSMHAQRLATVTAAATAATGAMVVSQTRNIAEQAAFARAVGVSVQTLQQWEFAAKAAGMQSGAIGDIFKDTAEKIGDFVNTGGGEAADLFEVLNLNIRDLMDLSPDKQLLAVANAFDEVGNRGAKIAFLESLGNDATLLLPLLENNAELLREQLDIADRIGVSIPQSDVDSIENANQALNELNELANGFASTVAANFAPSIVAMSQGTQELVADLGGMSEVVDKVATGTLLVSGLLGGRLASSMATATAATLAKVSADRSARLADAAASAANAKRTAETLRIAQSEQLAAQRAFESARAIAIATGNTTLRTKAITQMAAANQRAIAAEAAHTAAVNANSAAMGRASVVAQGMAGASRALSGALALVGGPLGAAVLAGAGIYAFREELGLTIPQIDANTTAVDKLTAGLDNMNEAAAQLTLTSLVGRLAEVRAQAEATAQEITKVGQIEGDGGGGFLGVDVTAQTDAVRELGATSNETQQEAANLEAAIALVETRLGKLGERNREVTPTITSVGDAAEAAARKAQQAAEAQAKALVGLQQEMDPLLADHAEYVERLAVLDRALAEGTISEEAYGEAVRWSAEQYQRAATGAEEYEKQTAALVGKYDSHRQKIEALATELQQINERYAAGEIGGAQYARMVEGVREAQYELALETNDLAQILDDMVENTGQRLDDAGVEMFKGLLTSAGNAMDQLEDLLISSIAEIGNALLLRPLTVYITGQLQGLLGQQVTGMSAPGGGGFNLNGISSLYNGAKKLPYVGDAISGVGSALGLGSSTAVGYSGALGAATSTGYGGALGSAVSGAAQAGGGFMSAASAAMPWLAGGLLVDNVLGLGITDGITKAISGLFGGGKTNPHLNIDTRANNSYGHGSVREGAFGAVGFAQGTRRSNDLFGGIPEEREFLAAIAASDDLLASLARSPQELQAMAEAVQGVRLSASNVEGVVSQLSRRTVAAVSAMDGEFGEFVASLGTDVDTIIARTQGAVAALDLLSGASDRLNLQFDASAAGALRAADSIAQMAGGVGQLASLQDSYYTAFFSDAERAADLQQDVAASLREMGLALPSTHEGFRQLVEQQNRLTESGQRNYVQLLQLAGPFDQLQTLLEQTGNGVDVFADRLSQLNGEISTLENEVRNAYAAFEKQSFDQQLQLLGLLGDEQAALALQRERELQGIDPLLQETQRRIWAMEDEAAAQQAATQAGQEYARSLAQVNDQLSSTFNGISQWVDQQTATAGTPGMNLAEAGDQFARQLVLAQSGDRNALQSITQYAEQYLAAGEAMYASGGAFQRIQGDVLDALKDLPDQISAEEYIAEEVKQALREQTQGISGQLSDVLRGDNPSNIAGNLAGFFTTLAGGIDGVLTRDQLAIVMSGKATDAELQAIMRAVDLNGDGVMDGLESVIIAGMPTDAVLGTVLRNKLSELDARQLTVAQVRGALSPIATDAEISRLIREVDVNGDGIITKQELANQRLAGLASGIGSTLKPMFDSIDLDASGLIDWDEFYGAFQGLASDAELRRIFRQLDKDGSGTISRLEALNRSSEGTEGNTQNLEERARDQLQELGGLVSEMTRSTGQFVALNQSIVSLDGTLRRMEETQDEIAQLQYFSARQSSAQWLMSEIEKSAGIIARASDQLSAQQQAVYDRFVTNNAAQGSTGAMDQEDWQRIRDNVLNNQNLSSDARDYILHRAATMLRESQIGDWEKEVAGHQYSPNSFFVNGSHATGLWNVPFDNYIAELHRDEMVVPAQTAGRLRELPSRELPMPALPNFPLLNRNDQQDLVRDLLNENKTLRKELTALLKRIEQHGAAGVAVQQEAAKQQISELKKSNLALDDMSAAARLEASR